MRLLHISDLHIGKRLHEQSLLEEQRHILGELVKTAREQSARAALIAGDVYDRSIPPVEAVDMLDDFITELAESDISVFIIAGNHDSAERLDFGARLMNRRGVYISGNSLQTVKLSDEYGDVNIWLLPYMRSQSVAAALESAAVDTGKRNIILAHQFVLSHGSGPQSGGSESVVAGGLDAVDAGLFDKFDYAALGHIHRPQHTGRDTVRYCGSPYRYSFDECSHEKSAVIVDIREKPDKSNNSNNSKKPDKSKKSNLSVDFVKLIPKRDLYRLKCKLAELPLQYQSAPKDSYAEVTLTDDEPVADAISKVREIYPNTLKLIIENRYSRGGTGAIHTLTGNDVRMKTPLELFGGFFEEMNGAPLSEAQREFLTRAIETETHKETGVKTETKTETKTERGAGNETC